MIAGVRAAGGDREKKHLLCCVELASEQNREQFMTLYFLLLSGTTLWFSAWFLRRRDKNYLWIQYQSLHDPGLPPEGTDITASHIESLPSLQKGRKVSLKSKPLTNYGYFLPKLREFISGKDPGSLLGLFACQFLVISYILSKAALYAIHSCRF